MVVTKSWSMLDETLYADGEVTPPVEPPETPPGKTYTQEELNSILANDKRKLREELESLKKAGDPKALAAKVKELSDSLLSKEELAKKKATEIEAAAAEKEAKLSAERDTWRNKFSTTLVDVEISKAASKHDAYDADQLALIIGPKTKLVEVTDDAGNGTGEFKSVTTIDLDGKPHTFPTVEAVGKLRDAGKFPNQFRVKGNPGTGATLNNNPTPTTDGKVPTEMGAFMKQFGGAIKGR